MFLYSKIHQGSIQYLFCLRSDWYGHGLPCCSILILSSNKGCMPGGPCSHTWLYSPKNCIVSPSGIGQWTNQDTWKKWLYLFFFWSCIYVRYSCIIAVCDFSCTVGHTVSLPWPWGNMYLDHNMPHSWGGVMKVLCLPTWLCSLRKHLPFQIRSQQLRHSFIAVALFTLQLF